MELPLTPSQTAGPYFTVGLTDGLVRAELVPPDTPGAIRIRGRLLDGAGEPVPDGMVELWQASPDGSYEPSSGFGRSETDEDGGFEFVTVKPGPVAGQAPHIAVGVFARGLNKRLTTRLYFPDEEAANAADHVLASLDPESRSTLVAEPEDGAYRFDIRLQGDRQTTFFAV
jgi:protocatechuate 3,4-dioxygenase, alpha subunit